MKMYQLSKQYRLLTPDDFADTDNEITAQLKQGEVFGLMDRSSGDCILINTSMYLFLKEYETPKKLKEVASVLADAFNTTSQEALPIAKQFFKEMKQRDVILSPRAVEITEIIEPYALGTLIDHYRIEQNLSSNLPLEVYKATDLHTNKHVILKVLRIPTHLPVKKQKQWRKIFKKEFAIQKILRGYPPICQLLHLTPDYAVLEWIQGISLRRHLEQGALLGTVSKQVLLSQIFASYAFMHHENILHGDVHTSNILILDDSTIKIIDFDLAHQLTKKDASPSVNGGVPEFIPPENIRFDAFSIVKGKASFQTEVYQLGVIAYWITYGKQPFSGDVWQDLATDILNNTIDFTGLSLSGAEVSPRMVSFLKKSLAKNPKKRFPSAVEMNDSFNKMLKKGDLLL